MKKSILLIAFIALCNLVPVLLIAQNVGIGIINPNYKLEVKGRLRIRTDTVNNIVHTPGIWLEDLRNAQNRIFFGMQDSIRAGFYGEGVGSVGWGMNFSARTGNVGIGRIAGSSRLEINDPNGGDVAFYKNNNQSGRIVGTDTTLQILATYGSTTCFPTPCPAKDLIIMPPTEIFSTSFPGRVGIGTNAPNAKFHIGGTGSLVMIGSGTPATGYALSVNGKIMSEELKVQMDANWPDYVFDKSYKLQGIDAMKDFIEKNKHLKNIPSAKEVAAEGILVGDMQKRMMEKIEELSLYIIQLHERIKKLESEKN